MILKSSAEWATFIVTSTPFARGAFLKPCENGPMDKSRKKPDFVVIGAMKCGTSTVCAYLEDHPQVFMVPSMDPNYFSDPDRFRRGPEWYLDLFAGRTDERIMGEGSNSYTSAAMFPGTARRLAEFNPDMRIVYIVRHPIKRMISAWVQNRADKGDDAPPDLDTAISQTREPCTQQG